MAERSRLGVDDDGAAARKDERERADPLGDESAPERGCVSHS
jgi:hypothetical protein